MSGVLFVCYIAFSIFALMNVVTGVFVESALQHAHRDRDTYMAHTVSELFHKVDIEQSGVMSWDEFERALQLSEMQSYFKEINIGLEGARGLFSLLDIDGSGLVDLDELVHGFFRLRGPAKSLDLVTLMQENRKSAGLHRKWVSVAEALLLEIHGMLKEIHQPEPSSTAP
eukprot:gnl/TRDRNA2_/TRDRNA2_171351_c0_seq2.p1 gnl/TRDRNA2_/TRDRNA2_171351_c0~~gnl/TRDRNA2_/TRDRNA2_171351_c0_seq2.p1  ORF type:complete len:170 (-),score=28.92 gnl/TRDRNA2_/TRDRNA2_171351_c0_seq2:378-887(-)